MYNGRLKARFIEEFTTAEQWRVGAAHMFEAFAPYETEYGADLCTWDEERMASVFQNLVGIRVKSSFSRLTILRRYAAWCVEKQVPGANPALVTLHNVSGPQPEKIRSQMVSSPAHLQQFLDAVLSPEDDCTTECLLRCYLWLAFIGLREEEALELPTTAVDLENLVIRYNGREYPFYREAIKAFRVCVRTDQFVVKRSSHQDKRYTVLPRAPGDRLLRGITTEKRKYSFRTALSRAIKIALNAGVDSNLQIRLGYNRVYNSGLFYRMYIDERAGKEPDFTEYARESLERVNPDGFPKTKLTRLPSIA